MAEQLQRLRLQEARLAGMHADAFERGDLEAAAVLDRARDHLASAVDALASIGS